MVGLGLTLKLRVGRKGYIILPKAIREAVGIEESDEVIVRWKRLEIVKKLLNTSLDCLDRRINNCLKNPCLRQTANDTPGHKLHSLLFT